MLKALMLVVPVAVFFAIGTSRALAQRQLIETIDPVQLNNYFIRMEAMAFTGVWYGILEVIVMFFVFTGMTLSFAIESVIVLLSLISTTLKFMIIISRMHLGEKEYTRTMLMIMLADLINLGGLLLFMMTAITTTM